jgi:hypothetical protein
MIIIQPLNGTPAEAFESYDEVFNSLGMDDHWSFTIYPPQRVAALYAHCKDPPEAMRESFEDNLPLIEICAGDYNMPLYIVRTPNVDMDYLKRKWCVDYCTWHHIVVREV